MQRLPELSGLGVVPLADAHGAFWAYGIQYMDMEYGVAFMSP